jgi:hypothetical protein
MPLIAAGIGAAGAIGGSLIAANSGGKVDKIRPGDIRQSANKTKNQLLFGNTVQSGPNKGLTVPGLDISSGRSSVNAGTGEVNIDPSSRSLRQGALNTFNTSLGGTRNALLGNKSAFNEARVNPLEETLARGRGELSRGLNRTGVRGTLRDRAIQDFDIQGERALGDQRAIAEQESLTAINSIDQLMFNANTGFATDNFNQELTELGFGLDTINIINSLANNLAVGSGNIAQSSNASAALVSQARSENITGALGAGLSAFGNADFGGGGGGSPPASNPGSGQGVGSLFP